MRTFQAETQSPDFEPGDIVVLRSGGPDMTVTDVNLDTGDVHCWWADLDGITDSGVYPFQALLREELEP